MSGFQEFDENEEYPGQLYNLINQNNNQCTCDDYNVLAQSPELNNDPNAQRKIKMMTVTIRTEEYLRTRRIPELIHYLMTKLLAQMPDNPSEYLENILDECMLYRAGHGKSPVIYEDGHLRAIIRSFDPSSVGWFTMDQVKIIFSTLGLPFDKGVMKCEENQRNISSDVLLAMLHQCQAEELLQLFELKDADDSEI